MFDYLYFRLMIQQECKIYKSGGVTLVQVVSVFHYGCFCIESYNSDVQTCFCLKKSDYGSQMRTVFFLLQNPPSWFILIINYYCNKKVDEYYFPWVHWYFGIFKEKYFETPGLIG